MLEDILVLVVVFVGIVNLLLLIYEGASLYAKDLWSYYKETDNKSNLLCPKDL